jgi:phenylpyruvate tautomerase PptA (4-oxalocrotonate tautomerase family)
MPILDVEVVGEPAACSAAALARAVGAALGAAEGSVWVRLRCLPAADYGENGALPEPLPVFVRVLARHASLPADAGTARRIGAAVARELQRPRDLVHVIFEPDAQGRVFFGAASVPDQDDAGSA